MARRGGCVTDSKTPEERARVLLREFALGDMDPNAAKEIASVFMDVVPTAIRAAVAAEREACARIADDGRMVVSGVSPEADTMARMIAAAIRAGKEGE
jgi:hypothetical protein